MSYRVCILSLIATLSLFVQLRAEEGMWIPSLLEELKIGEMQELGLQLSAGDIYNINHSGITDAVVSLGGFCTAELISAEGLMITNHHCGLKTIQKHSSLDKNYLADGFWAMDRTEEIASPGLYVRFLRQVHDVTEQMLEGVQPGMEEEERQDIIRVNAGIVKADVLDSSDFHAEISVLYHGLEYYLFLYEDFYDIRLVGAPPKSIGNFGGDGDNWIWPRHTGDFSLLRIYADSENRPAAYSTDNVPYRPSKHLKISLDGFDKGQFTMICGYPGRTYQYLVSDDIEWQYSTALPAKIKARTVRRDVMRDHMGSSEEAALKYASKYSSLTNSWKKWQGVLLGMEQQDLLTRKRLEEAAFLQWAREGDRHEYAGLPDSIGRVLDRMQELETLNIYQLEVVYAVEIIQFAAMFQSIVEAWPDRETEPEYFTRLAGNMLDDARKFYRDYIPEIDREIMGLLMNIYFRDIPAEYQPLQIRMAARKFQDNFRVYGAWLFSRSILTDSLAIMGLLENFNQDSYELLLNDPAYLLATEFTGIYLSIKPDYDRMDRKKNAFYRTYLAGLREWQAERTWYPDANGTMRISYGSIQGYRPRDAVRHGHFTTLEGLIEKGYTGRKEYRVPQKLRKLYDEKDFGEYAENGTIPVCFLASNHTSGGNSGSPILNENGHLIGVNFDRSWEATVSDYRYDPDRCRNISLDIRFALFIIDKFGGAGHLVDEMDVMR